MQGINETHDPSLTTWVPSTEPDAGDFPVQNLPFGRFEHPVSGAPTPGVAIGDAVLDLSAAARLGVFAEEQSNAIRECTDGCLNRLMGLDNAVQSGLRLNLSRLLRQGAKQQEILRSALVARRGLRLLRPVQVPNFTDFYTSIHHARNAGKLRRPDNPLLSNFHSLPVAYHGRASTVCVSGTELIRPAGQRVLPGRELPEFSASESLDFECELGIYIGRGTQLGERIPLSQASDHVFGFCLLNDCSARDIQAWESVPLGPFLAKSFLTLVSPWVVTMEAMAPFRVPAALREPGAPDLLPYLHHAEDRSSGGLSIDFSVSLSTDRMRKSGQQPALISSPKFKDQYWTVFQMITHHASNGCELQTGDLLGSGTVSGPTPQELGCLLEMTAGGRQCIQLPDGEERGYLLDGDVLTIKGTASRQGFTTIGFGDCTARVMPCRA